MQFAAVPRMVTAMVMPVLLPDPVMGSDAEELRPDTDISFQAETGPQRGDWDAVQVLFSPYYGDPDFTRIRVAAERSSIDMVSVADLLRNAFVYPPHSIFEKVKLVTYGFCHDDDMRDSPKFQFKFLSNGPAVCSAGEEKRWVKRYHELLCAAVTESCESITAPWLLQSGGKDSTSIAIAIAEARPDTTCITYLGGHEENEVGSATRVAKQLGLKHETLVCEPGRAYDRYLDIVDRLPLLTADFALLSYVDLATEVIHSGGGGVIDGLGSDVYFGTLAGSRDRLLQSLAYDLRLPDAISRLPIVSSSFKFNFALATLQMNPIERVFPGSRFIDHEVDELLGDAFAEKSRRRMLPFLDEIARARNLDERRAVTVAITEPAEAFAKGLYTTAALGLKVAYPYCNPRLRAWVQNEVPGNLLAENRASKMLVRKHIYAHFGELPYVTRKGSFRFDLSRLAAVRFDQVYDFATASRDFMPGAQVWLERNRRFLGNKYHASKFYLLAVILPWLLANRNSIDSTGHQVSA